MTEQQRPRPGSIALVTGASSGIGEATALRLAEAGCRVILAARRRERLEALAARLGDAGLAIALDVTDAAAIDALPDSLPESWRAIDILVNNAGHDVGGRRRFHEAGADTWAHAIETNVIGLMRVTRRLIEGMLERDHGHIVNIGSIAGYRPYATGTAYAASKFAVHGFSQCLRLDYANTGVRVTEILPGMVRTGFAEARWGDREQAARFYDEFGTCLEADDVARAVLYALAQPSHVVVAELVVVPVSQG